MRTPGKHKNTRRRASSVGQPLPQCMQCGKAATATQVDERNEGLIVRTTWCDDHAPGVWEIVARARRHAEYLQSFDNRVSR